MSLHTQRIIQNLGYSPAEAKVYLAALELGACTMTDIASKAGIPRTSVQEIAGKLRKEGLLNPITKQNRKYWIAENPDRLMKFLKERENALQSVLPELQSLRQDTGMKPSVKIFNGTEEIRAIFDDMLETKHHISAIVSWDDWIEFLGKEFVEDFIHDRYLHFLKIKLLTTRTTMSRELKRNDDKELRTTRYLSEDLPIHTSNFLYGNKVVIISLNKKMPVGTMIEDKEIFDTMKVLFESLWQQSEPV